MHELGVTQQIVEIAIEHARGAKITRMVLQIGRLAAVLPDAIRFCFDLCTEGTAAEGAALEIVETPGVARCNVCGEEFELERPYGVCRCGNSDLQWLSGDELKITEMEVL